MYNEIVKKFFKINDINPKEISELVNCNLYKKEFFLGSISKNIIYKPETISKISIGDIYGCDYILFNSQLSIFEMLNNYYKEIDKKNFKNGNYFFNRSNENLLLSSDVMIEKSNNSSELITINRVDNVNNINFIYTNGMHRFLALKAIYLSKIAKNKDKIDEIKKDFVLKVKLSEIDEIKTYCLFIIKKYFNKLNKTIKYGLEYDELRLTGRIIIVLEDKNFNSEIFVFDDNELIDFTIPLLESDLENYKIIEVDGFKNFLNMLLNKNKKLVKKEIV